MKAKITYSYPNIVCTRGNIPLIRPIAEGEIVDAIYRNNHTEIYFNDFCRVKIFGDAFKDKGPIQLEVV